ncbi:MAG: DUF2213 domain-containing protein [Deltaproteobacteria bacterium]|nr:DUF2213 domain-containing protein [Deltaproteobacteria bacterium]
MATVRSWERTPSGGVRLSAAITKAGVLTYRDTTGREWRELRPASEVFAEDSLRTLRGAPVTDLHPTKLVTPETWRELSVGHVGDDIAREDALVVASVLVQYAAEIARIEAGERKEISAGYVCEVDETPGITAEGERYDRVQRAIRYNHAALGPSGWGRAGADVSLRLDAAVEVVRAASAYAEACQPKGNEPFCEVQKGLKPLAARIAPVLHFVPALEPAHHAERHNRDHCQKRVFDLMKLPRILQRSELLLE